MMLTYLAREPSAPERLEFAIAYLCSITWNANRGEKEPSRPLADFLLFADAWKPEPLPDVSDDRYSDVDRSFMIGLGAPRTVQ